MSTLYFKTPGIAAVWLCEIRGQFSDGVFENHPAWERMSTREILYEFLRADEQYNDDLARTVDGMSKFSKLNLL